MSIERTARPEMLTTDTRSVVTVTLTLNGAPHTLHLEPRVSLLDAIREYAGLTGPK